MTPHVIYFDFDRTLLDTDALKQEQASRVAQITGLTSEEVTRGMQLYVSSINHLDFTPEGYAFYLEQLYGINPSDVLKIYVTDSNYIAGYLFPEVLPVLKKLSDQGMSLGIFSSAVPGYQLLKIERTGILEFIDRQPIISPRKLEPECVRKLPEGAVIIDDDQEVINNLVENHPQLLSIWCNRRNGKNHPKVRTIHNLEELEQTLSK